MVPTSCGRGGQKMIVKRSRCPSSLPFLLPFLPLPLLVGAPGLHTQACRAVTDVAYSQEISKPSLQAPHFQNEAGQPGRSARGPCWVPKAAPVFAAATLFSQVDTSCTSGTD